MNRVRFLSKIVLAASLVFAMAFSFSCSTDNEPEPTFYYSMFEIKDCPIPIDPTEVIDPNTEKSFEKVKNFWLKISQYGKFTGYSGADGTEAGLKNVLVERNTTPKDADEFIKLLKQRGNHIAAFTPIDNSYCLLLMYIEKN